MDISLALNSQYKENIRSRNNSFDLLDRGKTGHPFTVLDIDFTYDTQSEFFSDSLVNDATLARMPNEPSIKMQVSTTPGSRAVRQTKRYFISQSGKETEVQFSVLPINILTDPTVRFRAGFFDNHEDKTVDTKGDGVWLQVYQGQAYFVIRTSISGTQNDNAVIPQAIWNKDNLSGNGGDTNPSGLKIDWSKTVNMIFSFVRSGGGKAYVLIAGRKILVNQFGGVNTAQSPIWSRSSLPLRFEIERMSSGGGEAYCKLIDCSVNIYGGYQPTGKPGFADTDGVSIAVTTIERPIISIRPKNAYNRMTILPVSFEALNSAAADRILFRVYIGGTLTGFSWVSAGANSGVEYDFSATSINLTGAERTEASSMTDKITKGFEFENKLFNGSSIAGTQEIITILARTITGIANINPTINWQELK